PLSPRPPGVAVDDLDGDLGWAERSLDHGPDVVRRDPVAVVDLLKMGHRDGAGCATKRVEGVGKEIVETLNLLLGCHEALVERDSAVAAPLAQKFVHGTVMCEVVLVLPLGGRSGIVAIS